MPVTRSFSSNNKLECVFLFLLTILPSVDNKPWQGSRPPGDTCCNTDWLLPWWLMAVEEVTSLVPCWLYRSSAMEKTRNYFIYNYIIFDYCGGRIICILSHHKELEIVRKTETLLAAHTDLILFISIWPGCIPVYQLKVISVCTVQTLYSYNRPPHTPSLLFKYITPKHTTRRLY